ncbi:MAG: hypothetical protein ACTH29_00145 [Fusobacterium sp.]
MISNDKEIFLFLKLIKSSGDISNFISQGYTYSQIMETINWTIEQEYAKIQKGCLVLTGKGEKYLVELKIEKNVFILPRKDCKIKKVGLFDIYDIPIKIR